MWLNVLLFVAGEGLGLYAVGQWSAPLAQLLAAVQLLALGLARVESVRRTGEDAGVPLGDLLRRQRRTLRLRALWSRRYRGSRS